MFEAFDELLLIKNRGTSQPIDDQGYKGIGQLHAELDRRKFTSTKAPPVRACRFNNLEVLPDANEPQCCHAWSMLHVSNKGAAVCVPPSSEPDGEAFRAAGASGSMSSCKARRCRKSSSSAAAMLAADWPAARLAGRGMADPARSAWLKPGGLLSSASGSSTPPEGRDGTSGLTASPAENADHQACGVGTAIDAQSCPDHGAASRQTGNTWVDA